MIEKFLYLNFDVNTCTHGNKVNSLILDHEIVWACVFQKVHQIIVLNIS